MDQALSTQGMQESKPHGFSSAPMASSLGLPLARPEKWTLGDLAVRYITLRRDDDPMPPCVMVMITGIDGNNCITDSLESFDTRTIAAGELMGLEEALDRFDQLAEEMTVKSARIQRGKLLDLGNKMEPFPEWVRVIEWWEENPEDQPDGFAVMRSIIKPNP